VASACRTRWCATVPINWPRVTRRRRVATQCRPQSAGCPQRTPLRSDRLSLRLLALPWDRRSSHGARLAHLAQSRILVLADTDTGTTRVETLWPTGAVVCLGSFPTLYVLESRCARSKMRSVEDRPVKYRPYERATSLLGSAKVGFGEVSVRELRVLELGLSQLGVGQVRVCKNDSSRALNEA
jgi:hypothetical protein